MERYNCTILLLLLQTGVSYGDSIINLIPNSLVNKVRDFEHSAAKSGDFAEHVKKFYKASQNINKTKAASKREAA